MTLPRLLGMFAVALAWAATVHAASFDCAKTRNAAEKTICADPELSKADDAMAASYRAALAVTLDPVWLRRDQRDWLYLRDRPDTAHDWLHAYRSRIAELDKRAQAWRNVPREFAAAKLVSICFAIPDAPDDATCRVEETGTVDGDGKLRYQLQGLYQDQLRMDGAAVVFAPDAGDRLVPVVAAFGDTTHFSRPQFFTNRAGTFLFFGGYMEGTGNFNADHLYRRDGTAWRDLDIDSWVDTLARRLPKDLVVWKGIYPDYAKMTATTPLWDREKDGNCCPTGGRAEINLRLDGTRLAIDGLKVTRGEKAAEQE